MNARRRLEELEARARQRPARHPSGARRRMMAHLYRLAAWRRGELGPEEAAEVEAESAAIERRRREIRGEGGR